MINEREVICSFGKLEYIGVCFDNSGEQYAMIRNGDNITQKKLYETENKGYYFIYDNKRYYMSDGKPINTKVIEKNGKVITYINGVPHDWNEMIKINLKREAKEFQSSFNDHDYSYSELLERQAYFEKMGKRYGLLKEFKENGII